FISIIACGLSLLLVPLSQYGFAIPLLIASLFVGSLVNPVYNITQVSLRQAITPDRVQGRMNATVRTIIWGTIPIGALIGGTIGNTFGLVPAMYIGAAVSLLAGVWILLGPVRLKVQPQPA